MKRNDFLNYIGGLAEFNIVEDIKYFITEDDSKLPPALVSNDMLGTVRGLIYEHLTRIKALGPMLHFEVQCDVLNNNRLDKAAGRINIKIKAATGSWALAEEIILMVGSGLLRSTMYEAERTELIQLLGNDAITLLENWAFAPIKQQGG